MPLYQKSVLNKYLKQLDAPKVDKAYKKYANHFLNITIQDNIRNSKEEEYQGIFLEAQNLKQQINTIDKEIDAKVYELYG